MLLHLLSTWSTHIVDVLGTLVALAVAYGPKWR